MAVIHKIEEMSSRIDGSFSCDRSKPTVRDNTGWPIAESNGDVFDILNGELTPLGQTKKSSIKKRPSFRKCLEFPFKGGRKIPNEV